MQDHSPNLTAPVAQPTAQATAPRAGGILIEGLRKVYGAGDTAVEALKNVNL